MSIDDIYDLARHDKRLVECVEKLGKKANGFYANLQIAEFEGDKYFIKDEGECETLLTPELIDWVVVD